ncbi:MAG: hypothetical protein EOO29_25875 [Comamonadaceae bacterium]|nr:MAG: hypothetical protein EOO29_25875 [Comamonadaceae bacterium]
MTTGGFDLPAPATSHPPPQQSAQPAPASPALRRAQRCIRAAAATGLLTTVLTISVTAGAAMGTNGVPFSWPLLLEVLIPAGLTAGIHWRSRIAAALMLAYFLLSKALWVWNDLLLHDDDGGVAWADVVDSLDACLSGGLFVMVVLVCLYAAGVYGTVAWHRLQRWQ